MYAIRDKFSGVWAQFGSKGTEPIAAYDLDEATQFESIGELLSYVYAWGHSGEDNLEQNDYPYEIVRLDETVTETVL